MVNYKITAFFILFFISGLSTSDPVHARSIILLDSPSEKDTGRVTLQSPQQYRPVNPPAASVAPILDVDPDTLSALEMRPNESEAQFYERTKRYYEESVKEMDNVTKNHFKAMEQLRAPEY